ncbi:MAG: hypothetical protein AAFN91_09035 [Pseudomonadota bacterium]
MKWYWTWEGKCFGYRKGDDLWTHDGKHIGQFHGDEVYGTDGRYLGEEKSDKFLITHQGKSNWRKHAFSPRGRVTGYVAYADYTGYAMYAGYEDFPDPKSF